LPSSTSFSALVSERTISVLRRSSTSPLPPRQG
jgi:hypothetical protein